jgi:hypothetical protein
MRKILRGSAVYRAGARERHKQNRKGRVADRSSRLPRDYGGGGVECRENYRKFDAFVSRCTTRLGAESSNRCGV